MVEDLGGVHEALADLDAMRELIVQRASSRAVVIEPPRRGHAGAETERALELLRPRKL